MSDAGASAQPVHFDLDHTRSSRVTLLVALQDVDEDMGPTVFLPRTHFAPVHARFNDNEGNGKNELLKSAPQAIGLLG